MRSRLVISGMVGLLSGLFCYGILGRLHLGAYDFTWALMPAREFLAGRNPYAHVPPGAIAYPMTAVLLAMPFVRMADPVAAGLFFGISSGLLALGLTRHGYHRLLIFIAYPYWAALLTAQWIPLIMAGALFPVLLPLTTTKPQIGIPVFLTHMRRRGIIACLLFVGLTFIVMPTWMRDWLAQAVRYEHFYPMLVLPGPLLLLALRRYRERGAQLLLLSSVMPQRWFFDAFTLWLIPRSRREVLYTAVCSWSAGIWRWYHVPHNMSQVGRWAVVFLYLPMLVVVLLRPSMPAAEDELAPLPTRTGI